jgi:hypothetical protein
VNDVEMAVTTEDRVRAANHIQHKTMPTLWKTAQKLANIYADETFRLYSELLRHYESLTKEQQEGVLKCLRAEQEAENEGQ